MASSTYKQEDRSIVRMTNGYYDTFAKPQRCHNNRSAL